MTDDAPQVTELAILALRNMIALSVQWKGARTRVSRNQFFGVYWTDHFDLYPFVPGKKHGTLTSRTPDLRSIDFADCFEGQTSSLLSGSEQTAITDVNMLNELVRRWNRHFVQKKPNKITRALFRSMVVAFEAGRVPNRLENELYGSRIGDWVSAIEVLCKPRVGHMDRMAMVNWLADVNWMLPKAGYKRYIVKVKVNGQWKKIRVSLVQKICDELYQTRNSFLHGETINSAHFYVSGDKNKSLLLFVAPIMYRIIISNILGLYPSDYDMAHKAQIDFLYLRAVLKPYEQALLESRQSG